MKCIGVDIRCPRCNRRMAQAQCDVPPVEPRYKAIRSCPHCGQRVVLARELEEVGGMGFAYYRSNTFTAIEVGMT